MRTVKFFYDAAPTGGGGGGFSPSLADLGVDGNGGIIDGDGTPKITDITEVIPESPQKNQDGTITKIVDHTIPVEGINVDGTLKEGYVKNENGEVVKEVPSIENDEEIDFFTEVNRITGRDIIIEYPEDVDPVSPEGVAIREQKLLEIGKMEFEETLKEQDPRAYAYFLHRMNGKDDDTFFERTNGGFLLPSETDLVQSADIQEKLFRYDLQAIKGLDEDMVNVLVLQAIKDNKLKEKAENSFNILKTIQTQELKDAQLLTDQILAQERRDIENMDAIITKTTKELSFMVPDTEQKAFQEFVRENLRYEDGKFFIVQEVSDTSLKQQMETLLFHYKKGDLSKIIKREAEKKASQRLQLKLAGDKGTKNNGEPLGSSRKAGLTLGEIIT